MFYRESQNNDSEVNTYEPTAVTHSSPAMPPLQQSQQHQHQHRQRHNNTNNQYNQRHEQQQLQMQQHHKQQQQHHPTISIRRLDTLRPDFTNTTSATPPNNINTINTSSRKRSHRAMAAAAASSSSATAYNQQQQQLSSLRQSSHDDNESAISSVVAHNKRHRHLNGRELKYTAFGNFISSSLMDLPASIALELVEKFTSDVVKALMEKAEQEQHCKDVENFH